MTQITANIWWNNVISEGEIRDKAKLPPPPKPEQMVSICKSIAPVLHSHLSGYLIDNDQKRFWAIVRYIMAKVTGINPFPDPQSNFPMFILLFYTFRDNFNPKTIEHAIFYLDKMCVPKTDSPNTKKKFLQSAYISDFFFHDFIFIFSNPALLIFTFHQLNEMQHPFWLTFIEHKGSFERFFDLFFSFLSPLDTSNFLSPIECQQSMQINIYLIDLFIKLIMRKFEPVRQRRIREIDENKIKESTFTDQIHNENEGTFSLFVMILKSLYQLLYKILKHSDNYMPLTSHDDVPVFSSKESHDVFNYESFHANILRYISILQNIIFDSCDEFLLETVAKKVTSNITKDSKWRPFFFDSIFEQMAKATKILASQDSFQSNPAGLFNDKYRFYDEENPEQNETYSTYEIYRARRLMHYFNPAKVAVAILTLKSKLKENPPANIYWRIKALSRMLETWPLLIGSPVMAFFTRLFFQDNIFMRAAAGEITNFFQILNRMCTILRTKRNEIPENGKFIKNVLKMKKKSVDSFYNYFTIFIRFAFISIRQFIEREKYINRSIQFLMLIFSEDFITNNRFGLEIKKNAEVLLELPSTGPLISHFYHSLRDNETKQLFESFMESFEGYYRFFQTFSIKSHPFCKNGNHLIQTDDTHLFEPENFIDPRIIEMNINLPEKYLQFITFRNDISPEVNVTKPEPIYIAVQELVLSNTTPKAIQNLVSQHITSYINQYDLTNDQKQFLNDIEDSIDSEVKRINTFSHTVKHSRDLDVSSMKGYNYMKKCVKALNNLLKEWEKKEYQVQITFFDEIINICFILMSEIVVHPNIYINISRLKIYIEKEKTSSQQYLEMINKRVAIKIKAISQYNQMQKNYQAYAASLKLDALERKINKAAKLPQKPTQPSISMAKTSILSGGDVPTQQPVSGRINSADRRVPRNPIPAIVEDFYNLFYNHEKCDSSIINLSAIFERALSLSSIKLENNIYLAETPKTEETPKVEQEDVEKKKPKSSSRKGRASSTNRQDVLVQLAESPQKHFLDSFEKSMHSTIQNVTLSKESLQTVKHCLYRAMFDKLFILETSSNEERPFYLFRSSENDSINSTSFCNKVLKKSRQITINSLHLPFDIKPIFKTKTICDYFGSDEMFNFSTLGLFSSPIDMMHDIEEKIDYTIDSLALVNDKSSIDVNSKIVLARAMLISNPPNNIIEITKLLAICDFIISANGYQEIQDIFISAVKDEAEAVF